MFGQSNPTLQREGNCPTVYPVYLATAEETLKGEIAIFFPHTLLHILYKKDVGKISWIQPVITQICDSRAGISCQKKLRCRRKLCGPNKLKNKTLWRMKSATNGRPGIGYHQGGQNRNVHMDGLQKSQPPKKTVRLSILPPKCGIRLCAVQPLPAHYHLLLPWSQHKEEDRFGSAIMLSCDWHQVWVTVSLNFYFQLLTLPTQERPKKLL